MADEFPGGDGFGDTKGWDRASIGFRSRKPYVPIPPWVRLGLLCVALAGFTVLLFVFSTFETRQLRRLAKEL